MIIANVFSAPANDRRLYVKLVSSSEDTIWVISEKSANLGIMVNTLRYSKSLRGGDVIAWLSGNDQELSILKTWIVSLGMEGNAQPPEFVKPTANRPRIQTIDLRIPFDAEVYADLMGRIKNVVIKGAIRRFSVSMIEAYVADLPGYYVHLDVEIEHKEEAQALREGFQQFFRDHGFVWANLILGPFPEA